MNKRIMTANSQTQPSLNASADFLKKLKGALGNDGDFPASARLVSQIRELSSRPEATAQQVADLILREPTLGTRILHFVNSSFYGRSNPILTISEAVIQVGMQPIAELCTNLILLQKFIPLTRRSGPFAQCFQKTIATSLLTSIIASQSDAPLPADSTKAGKESAYLAGTFGELGLLLTSFYFPKLFDSAQNRAALKEISLSKSIQQIVGLTPTEISLEVLQELSLPKEYHTILSTTSAIEAASDLPPEQAQEEISRLISNQSSTNIAQALFVGGRLAESFGQSEPRQHMETVLIEIKNLLPLEMHVLTRSLKDFVDSYDHFCTSMEVALPSLPSELLEMDLENTAKEVEQEQEKESAELEGTFSQSVVEIQAAVENLEPLSGIITTVMETVAWSLKFERVLLMLLDKKKLSLSGRMLLGSIPDFDPKKMSRPVNNQDDGDITTRALMENTLIYEGVSLLPEGVHFAVMPVGFDTRRVGIIYADRTVNHELGEPSEQERAALR
ncbi:MAG: HDOD domain-containing protein, partial [Bdellovibrionota bacterium]